MPALGVLLLPGLIMMGISFSLVVLAFCAYYRLKGIEKALQEIAFQIQISHAKDEPSVFTR